MATELKDIQDILKELREAAGHKAVVSISYDGDDERDHGGLTGLISFHKNGQLVDKVKPIEINFAKSDFKEGGWKKVLNQIHTFVPGYVERQLDQWERRKEELGLEEEDQMEEGETLAEGETLD
jgi:hypothetical protein